MSRLLAWLNTAAGMILFFGMSGITQWVIFASPQAKVFPFLIGILLLVNAVYLAVAEVEPYSHRS